jgi:signal transduction histidine kinase
MKTDRIRYGWKFLLTVALPLLLAFIGTAALTLDLVSRVSTGANREDHARAQQTVISALAAAQQQLEKLAIDNANWNDAVRGSYGTVDYDWFLDTWGALSGVGDSYDAVMLVDRQSPEAVIGTLRGEKFTPGITQFLSKKFEILLDTLPQDISSGSATFQSRSSILNTSKGLAIVATAPILPTSEDVVVPSAKPRYFVLVKFLTPQYLDEIGKQYIIPDFQMAAVDGRNAGGQIINDFMGTPIAAAQWTDRKPGDIALVTVRREALFALSSLALALIGITLLCWKSIIGHIEAVKAEAEANNNAEMFKDLNHQVTLLNMELVGKVKLLHEAREENLRKAKMAQLGSLVATIAHELRNPLSVVRTSIFIVRRKLSENGIDLNPQLRRIDAGIARCNDIISQLLDYSRSQLPNITETDIDAWLEKVLHEETAKLPEDLTIEGRLNLQGLKAKFDPDRMARSIGNLLSNAAEAMFIKNAPVLDMHERAPRIVVSTRLTARGIEISVEDNGPGIPHDLLTKIRDPLFTTKSFGTGLGIPVAEKTAELHGGGLDIESTVDKGTRLTLWLPVTKPAQKELRAA